MPREARPWFRFYCETFWDRKIRRLEPDLRWLWGAVLAAARQSPVPGVLLIVEDAMVVDDLADLAAIPAARVDAGIAEFLRVGMLVVDDETGGWAVAQWGARQFESDSSTERARRARSGDVAAALQHPAGDGATRSESDSDPEPPSISGLTRYGVDPQAVWDHIARAALKVRQAKGGDPVRDPEAWLRRARQKAQADYGAKAVEMVTSFVVTDPAEVAGLATGTRSARHLDRRAS